MPDPAVRDRVFTLRLDVPFRCGVAALGVAVLLSAAGVSCCSSQGHRPAFGRTDDTADSKAESPAQPSTADSGVPASAHADARMDIQQGNPLAGCTMCHVDVEDRLVGSPHFESKIGCKTCHGASEGHVADENNNVKPERVFARNEVDRLCAICHDCSRPQEKRGRQRTALTEPVCIDCHGHHDLVLLPIDDC